MGYIKEKYPDMLNLYKEIYIKSRRLFWDMLDEQICSYVQENEMGYVRDDDGIKKHLTLRLF